MGRRIDAALALGAALALSGAAGIGTAVARPADGVPAVEDARAATPEPDGAPGAVADGSGTGALRLREGRHGRWIDRVELPGYARRLYDLLVEATDADGVDDLLIGEAAFAGERPPATTERWREPGEVVGTANGTYLTLGSAGKATLDAASEAASVAFAAFDRDHPEVFWLTGSCRVGGFVDGEGELLVGFKLADPGTGFDLRQAAFRDEGVLRAAIVERDEAVARLLEGIVPVSAGPDRPDSSDRGMAACEAVRRIQARLADANAYNSLVADGTACDDPLAWECLSALRGSSGEAGPTCEGYARAFKVLCDAVDIPCTLTRGLARHTAAASAERHMWNLVQIEGSWYAVDVTWDDVRDGAAGQGHLLAGSGTVVGAEGAFGASHVATDETFPGMARLSNGPELARERFVPTGAVAVRRLWNVASGAHLLTADPNEYRELEEGGEWRGEGVRFYGEAAGGVEVRRLWNPSNGDHLYSADRAECRSLAAAGWVDEGVSFRGSSDGTAAPVYRLWNRWQLANGGLGSHLWTEDAGEYRSLPERDPVGAWLRESVAWRCAWLP